MATALTSTTTSAAISSGDTIIPVASVTNLSNPVKGMTQKIYVMDQGSYKGELMAVDEVIGTTAIRVTRLDTFRSAHMSGSLILIANVDPTISRFHTHNPTGYQVANTSSTTPWVNVTTGEQWLYSSVTGTWVPGFGNPAPKVETASHASGTAAMVVSGPLFHVTGTGAVTSITVPLGYNGGEILVINDGAWTWTAANNIGAASVGAQVAATVTRFMYDYTNSKWVANGRA